LQQARQVRLELHLECESMEWFPARLRHLLDNLLGFALKQRDPTKEGSWVRLACRSDGNGHELRVEDNGVGLTPPEVGGAFELFFRSSRARAAGLETGLAIVRFLVEQSGGTVEVESRAGEGSSFTVRLPPYALDDYLA
jgi:signal transduction histidine kinase